MLGVVKIEDDLLKPADYDVSEIVGIISERYPDEASAMSKVAKDMADRGLLLDEDKILEYWHGELERIGVNLRLMN